jgi:hypothetical protein
LDRAALKVGTSLNGKRLVVNIANDMRLRFQNNVSTLNRTLDFPDHTLSCNSSGNMSPAGDGDNERSAVQFAVNLTIDLDQALSW